MRLGSDARMQREAADLPGIAFQQTGVAGQCLLGDDFAPVLRAGGDALKRKGALFKHLAKFRLLILDDFGLAPIAHVHKRHLLETVDNRFDKSSSILASQLSVEQWHGWPGEPTLDDASARPSVVPRRALKAVAEKALKVDLESIHAGISANDEARR